MSATNERSSRRSHASHSSRTRSQGSGSRTSGLESLQRQLNKSRVSDVSSSDGQGSLIQAQVNLDDTPKGHAYELPEAPPIHVPPVAPIIKTDSAIAGHSAEDYFNGMVTTPSDETPTTQGALERRRLPSHHHSHGLSSSRRTRSRSSTKELVRMLVSHEDRESREALSLLRRTSERLEQESNRANEAERRVQEANDRWKLVNQARLQAQSDAARVNEELRLYKLQLEEAQAQITRANDMISQTDKERALAEDEAAKSRRTAKRYEMELLIKQAKEEGRRMGRREGYEEARFRAEAYRREESNAPYPAYEDGYDETFTDDVPVPVAYEDEMQEPIRSRAPLPSSRGQTAPQVRRRSLVDRIRGRNGGMDRNVEVNHGAPDIAPVMLEDADARLRSLASPVSRVDVAPVTQIGSEFGMPQPNFNPNPAEVPPISINNMPRTPMHAPLEYPPEGYIPRADEDGAIRLPPPHELAQAPPSPREYTPSLPPGAGLPEVEPVHRERSFPELIQPPRRSRRMHQYPGSVGSSDTSNLSIISPPKHPKLAKEPILSAIPEASPRNSARGSMNGYPSPRTGSAFNLPMSTRHGSAMSDGPVRPDVATMGTPRSVLSRFPTGPKRPSKLTTPAPLANSLPHEAPEHIYSRPRLHSGASDAFTDATSVRSREPSYGERSSRRSKSASAVAPVELQPPPEITIDPPSSLSESLQSRRSSVLTPRGSSEGRMLDRSVSEPPLPITPIPEEVPYGFIPGSPIPPGFMSTADGQAALGGPVPPPGFVPTSETGHLLPTISISSDHPPGFIPTSSVVEQVPLPHSPIPDGAPTGFVPTSTIIPHSSLPGDDRPPPGFIPASTAARHSPLPSAINEGPPLGFVPTSTISRHSPLPSAHDDDGPPPGFIPSSTAGRHSILPSAPDDGPPPGFIPSSTAGRHSILPSAHDDDGPPPGFIPSSTAAWHSTLASAHDGSPLGFVPTSSIPRHSPLHSVQNDGPPPGFVPTSSVMHHLPLPSSHSEGPPPGFVRTSSGIDLISLSGKGGTNYSQSPMGVAGALPVLARSVSDNPVGSQTSEAYSSMRSPRISFQGPNAGFNSRAASEWDTRSAWGNDSRAGTERSPRPVRGPEFAASPRVSSRGVSRPGTSMSRREGAIPEVAIYDGTSSRNRSRVGFDEEPAEIPLSSSMAPSRASSAGFGTARSALSDRSRARAANAGTPSTRAPALSRSAGLSTPYARPLDTYPEDDDFENEIVPSSDESANTLTTPPGAQPSLPPRGARTPSRSSIFVPPDPEDAYREREMERRRGRDDRLADPNPIIEPGQTLGRTPSLSSRKSYSKFASDDYIDPAVMASGKSILLPLPNIELGASSDIPVAVKAKKAKSGKGKGRKK